MARMPPFRALPSSQRRACVVINLTIFAVALSYGALSQAAGFPLWQTVMLAALAIGGAAELTFVGVVSAGGSPLLAVLGGLMVNSRNFAFGLNVGGYAPRGWRTWAAAHLVNDETVAFARAVPERRARWEGFVVMALTLFPSWVGGAALGQLLGSVFNAEVLGLDAAFPVILFCLILNDLRDSFSGITTAAGALLATLAIPVLPLGLGAVSSLLVLIPAALFLSARQRRLDDRSGGRAEGRPGAGGGS